MPRPTLRHLRRSMPTARRERSALIPVHPVQQEIEGAAAVTSVAELPDEVTSISVITPPQITETVVRQAVAKGVNNIWMQPGAESDEALRYCEEQGVNLIADGTCVLMVLGCSGH